ncbi:O-antigen ligase family protein [Vibrio antiquarius]|uniref:O-antigen ligase family protein n=1 Tax=Vibrio antiquarius (strain Ex25) TaxID=150340 RepID=UPI0026595073|nr:O-antigen ligase family protein [Vibrio antiquarius]MCR9849264.1 O-antigen ligase family protein [Vibrio antiquarius]MCR9911431.1 O-antigen ligase family protein [Vibrio antiquarius]
MNLEKSLINYLLVALVVLLISINVTFLANAIVYYIILLLVCFLVLTTRTLLEFILAFTLFGQSITHIMPIPFSLIIIALGGITFTYFLVKYNKWYINLKVLSFTIILGVFYFVSAFQIDSEYGLFKVKYLLLYCLFFVMVYPYLIHKSYSNYKINMSVFLLYGVVLISSIFILTGNVFEVFGTYNPTSNGIGLRAISEYDSIYFGRSAGLLLFISVFSLEAKNKNTVLVCCCSFILASFLLYFSQTRQGFIALLAITLIYLFFYANNNIIRLTLGMVASFSFFLFRGVSLVDESGRLSINFDNRSSHWSNSIEIISANPIFGKGIGNYMDGLAVWPHNIFLEILVELNLGFVIAFSFLLSYCIYVSLKNLNSKIKQCSFLSYLLIYYILCAQISADFSRNTALFFSMIVILIFNSRTFNHER